MSQDQMNKFWMVYGLNRSSPTYKHYSKENAQEEAKRLAQKCPGETFVVLSAVAAYTCPIAPVESIKLRKPTANEVQDLEIPF